ncbi:DUF1345 domain-containing protein [Streptomyces sp. JH14]|uniref:DUF1345 domain-containing protein n=1 Tax=Streptomyces sp. JH14 TaxID=2793630 RepID=UPI0023FA0A03|nr:DUF1345 domain-containing protein [Streptomyces sp. JH14]MDF6041016.1 DUF1345 domain-containing protein [Streptomyces sp. JH14]
MSGSIALGAAVILLFLDWRLALISVGDTGVLVLFSYLLPYLVLTLSAFTTVSPERLRAWAGREARGTVLQRYVYGTAPGPGGSIFIAVAALLVAVVWLPGYLGSAFPVVPRVATALSLVVVAWLCVLFSFAVTFQADNLVEGEQALLFPGEETTAWADYVYFALAVMTTFGTTDVTVVSREMRRTVAANAAIAFVFNTVTVASLVSALGGV